MHGHQLTETDMTHCKQAQERDMCNITVGKHIPCKLSLVYTSYSR